MKYKMAISSIYDSMFKTGRKFLLLVLIGQLLPGILLFAQDRGDKNYQLALEWLDKKDEVNIEFYVESTPAVIQTLNFLSIRRLDGSRIIANLNYREFQRFVSLKIPFVVVDPIHPKEDTRERKKGTVTDWTAYPAYEQYDSIMQKFAVNYPGICRLDTLGESIEGRHLFVVKISDNVNLDEPEPEFMYSSTMHGDETGGFILMLHLIDYLLEHYQTDPSVTTLIDNLEIWINPLANPDGTYAGGNETVYASTRRNANAVDLNRNFPDPEDGPHPDGNDYQPETLAMIDFMNKRKISLSANFHSGSEVLNYPWDTWETRHADDAWFQYIAHEYADTVHEFSSGYMTGFNDGITNGYDWYSISGGRQDYITFFRGGREITMELDYDFITPESQLLDLWNYNYRSLLHYMEQTMFGISGVVTDSVTGEPLCARIEVIGHDYDSTHVYSDSIHGDYYRLIEEGTYQVQFTAPGYHDKTIDNVFVQNRQKNQLDVPMVPLNSARIQIPSSGCMMNCFPNPFRSTLMVSLDLDQPARLEFQIFDILGKRQLVPHSSFHSAGSIQISLNLNRLPPGTYIIRSVISGSIMDQKIIKKF